MRRAATVAVATLFAISIGLVASIAPASAGSFCAGSNATNAPDGRIKQAGSEWDGDGTYPEQGFGGETLIGEETVFKFRWRNVAGDNLTIRVNLHDESKPSGVAARWFLKGANVNAVLKGGKALVFRHLAPGSSTPAIKLAVKNKSAPDGRTLEYLRGRYAGSQPNRCDLLFADAPHFDD